MYWLFAGQASPVLEGISEEGSAAPPERFVVPPPPPRMVLPHPEALGPAPEKPARPPYVNLSEFIPPPPEEDDGVNTTPLHLQLCETNIVISFISFVLICRHRRSSGVLRHGHHGCPRV